MSYVKSISIRSTVNRSIKYILNPDKTEGLLYVSGINCVADKDIAYNQFLSVYNRYNDKLYNKNYNNKINKGKKAPVKAHHFIQSFKEGEVTPELANKIANEWAKEVFGDNRQIVIATHIDKGHVHNHFIVNSLDFDGKKYYGNKYSLNRARSINDQISKKYGLDIIQGNLKKGVQYKEWAERKKGTSWKHDIKLSIDKAILKVNNIEELIDELKNNGYEIKKGKYISIKAKGVDRYVRTKTLGIDYAEDKLIERIKNKHKELPIIQSPYRRNRNKNAKHKYRGIQLKYVSLIKLVSNLIINGNKPVRKYNRRKPYSIENDYDINVLATQLRLLNRENITTEEELNNKFNEVKNIYNDTKKTIDNLTNLNEGLNGVINNAKNYFNLSNKKELTNSEKLKLTIAKTIVNKYNITNVSDLNKLELKLNDTNIKIQSLILNFKDIEKRFKEFELLKKINNQIKNNTYISDIQRSKTERER